MHVWTLYYLLLGCKKVIASAFTFPKIWKERYFMDKFLDHILEYNQKVIAA